MSVSTVSLDPELRQALIKNGELTAALGLSEPGLAGVRSNAELVRAYWNQGGPTMDRVTSTVVSIPSGRVRVAIYRPNDGATLLPAFVYLHGGGFKLGSEWTNDRQMREIAKVWGGIVISADYSHAPENVFPAAVDQTAQLLLQLHEHGNQWGVDGERIACGGCSAGASVSFGAAVSLGRVPWLRAAVGIVGAFSGDTSTDSMQRYGTEGLFPDLASVPPIFNDYLPLEADRSDPRANPLLADPRLLPPTFLAAAEFDVFRDSSDLMARSLESCGRLYGHKVYPNMSHLFFGFSRSVDGAKACVSDVSESLMRLLPV